MFCFQSRFARSSRMTLETTSASGGSPPSTVALAAVQRDDKRNKAVSSSSSSSSSSTPSSSMATNVVGTLDRDERRHSGEATSEGSASSSIKFIDQVSISGGSSTETLPGIRTDYFDTDPLSAETKIESVNAMTINDVTGRPSIDKKSNRENGKSPRTADIHADDNDSRANRSSGAVPAAGCRWRGKLLLRLRSSESSNLSNGEPASVSTPSSCSPVSMTDNSARSSTCFPASSSSPSSTSSKHSNYATQRNNNNNICNNRQESSSSSSSSSHHRDLPRNLIARPEGDEEENNGRGRDDSVGKTARRTFGSSMNDAATIAASSENDSSDAEDNGDEEEEEEEEEEVEEEEEEEDFNGCNYAETETEDGTSLPSSPAATLASSKFTGATAQPPTSIVPNYYGFLSVNGGAMRQETTSTSSPQLSSSVNSVNDNSGEVRPLGGVSGVDGSAINGHSAIFDNPKIGNVGASLKPDCHLEAASCLPAARSCPNLEQRSPGCSSASPSPSPGPAGPRFKPLAEGDIQVCYLNHTRTLVSKILSSKFLRRWENHHLYLNDACLSSRTLTGFLQQPVAYSSMSEVYAVARWDPTYKYCLRIVLPDGSLLLQASNAYTRDQWYHSILWKKSIFKYQHLVSTVTSTREETVLRELKAMVDFALWTPLQDERVNGEPLEAVAKLLAEDPAEEPAASETGDKKLVEFELDESPPRAQATWAEAVLRVAAPLLERAAPPAALARVLSRLAERHPRSPLVIGLCPAITRCLKHTVDFGKSPDMRKLLQVFLAALYENDEGERAIRDYIASVHGPGSDCPHPRILPNLVSICVAAIFHRFQVAASRESRSDNTVDGAVDNTDYDRYRPLPPLTCYLVVLKVASEYADWRPGLGSLLQPVPFPERALADKELQEYVMLSVMRRLAADPRCSVHRVVLPVREPRSGWIHIAAPSSNDACRRSCPDEGKLFGEMLTTLLGCCCRRKRFVASLVKQTWRACMLLGVRGCEAAQESLCLMLEWRLLPNEEHRLEVVSALQSTETGRNRYAMLCQRQKNFQELQRKGGPKKLTLPARATDADLAVILAGGALGNLKCLTLAFTSVTSACAEQLIKLPALRYLNLWATQFGDAGLQMISEHLQKLQVLNLCETPVSDKGISTLASLTSLRKLNLNSTKLSARTFESLKKRLPALQEFDVRYTEAW